MDFESLKAHLSLCESSAENQAMVRTMRRACMFGYKNSQNVIEIVEGQGGSR